MSSKLAEGKKAPKDVTQSAVNPMEFDFSDAFISTLTPDFIRGCLALRLRNCRHCVTKGFVLDAWGPGSSPDLISSISELSDILHQQISSTEPQPVRNEEIQSRNSSDFIFIEVCPSTAPVHVDLFCKSIGVASADGKNTKEQTAAIKAFETRFDGYIAKMRDVRVGESGSIEDQEPNGECDGLKKVSGLILQLPAAFGSHFKIAAVSRMDSAEATGEYIVDKVLPQLHGKLGWLADNKDAGSDNASKGAQGSIIEPDISAQIDALVDTAGAPQKENDALNADARESLVENCDEVS
jgi:hypothetical protein